MQKPDHVIQISRRDAIAVTAGITGVVFSSTSHAHNQGIESNTTNTTGTPGMNHVRTKDGTEIFFKDWGKGQPVVFSHGWPLSADDWDAQMFYFASRGFRCIAHDRRGHGRSTQTWDGNNMDTYADDLMDLVEKLDLKQAIHVGHSTGGGEVARYVGRHGAGRAKGRIAKAVLIGAVPPIMVKSANNPVGLPKETFDGFRASLLADRAQFFRDVASGPFYGFNLPGAKVSQGLIDNWWRQGMMAGVNAAHDCIAAFSETDFTEDLKRFNVPTLIMHSEDDQIVPIAGSAMLSSKLVPGAALKVYKGFGHGMCSTHHAEVNPDLLAFFKA
jgi:non-heme chloroperoxidase